MNTLQDELKEIEKQAELGILSETGSYEEMKRAIDILKNVPCEIFDLNIQAFAKVRDKTFIVTNGRFCSFENLDTDLEKGLLINDKPFKLDIDVEETIKLFNSKEAIKQATDYTLNERIDKINSFDELKNLLIDYYKSRNFTRMDNSTIFNLFFENVNLEANLPYYFSKILKVIEIDNLRICAVKEFNRLVIIFANPESEHYNYLDEGRYFYRYDDSLKFFDMEIKDDNINMIYDLFDDLSNTEIEHLPSLIDKRHIDDLKNQRDMQEKLEKERDEKKEKLKEAILNSYRENGFVVINGIKISKDGYAEFEGRKIGSGYEFIKDIDLTNEQLDFNELFNDFCEKVSRHKSYSYNPIWLGKFSIEVVFKSNFLYIRTKNKDYRINKNELNEVLKRGICFDSLEDYEKLLSEVSKCSIKIHNILSQGLIIHFESKYNRYEKTPIKLNIIREKNKHFIVIGNRKIKIHNINALLNLTYKYGRLYRDFNYISAILMNNTDLNENEVMLVLKDGLKEYKEAIRKSEELLKETIEVLNIKEAEIDNKKGYIVNGKLRTYFITDDLKIYEYPNMKYICVIDKGRADDVVGKDRLISRLYALSNDNLVIDDIHTLRVR